MYSLKLTDTALRNPNNNRYYNDFSHAPDVQFHLSKGGISLTSQVPYLLLLLLLLLLLPYK